MEAESAESDSKELLNKRACDQCRLRKVRCDKRSPCSNCRSAQVICRSTGAGQKPKEDRRRVLISSQYEKKIDLIEERLSNIEDVLSELKSYFTSGTTIAEPCYHTASSPKEHTPAGSGYTSNTTAALDQYESGTAFEGNSSLAAHSVYASTFLETVVSRSAPQISTPKVNAALAALKQMVNMQSHPPGSSSREVRLPNQKDIRDSNLRDLVMPPMQVVVGILRRIKEHPPFGFQCFFPFLEVDEFIQKCREVYFATEDYSDATFIVANGGLYHVFIEYSFLTSSPQIRADYQKYIELCRNNLETALANLSLLMPTRPESIEALTLGAVHAIEISKPSFAWTLTSTAARLCQTLGYHRGSFMDQNSNKKGKERELRLFWTVYCLDKGLSLRLGRASTIQDYDTTLPNSFGAYAAEEPWRKIYQLWVKMATIQGKVYEQLYSPAGLGQAEHERVFCARQLASEMEISVMEQFKKLSVVAPVMSEIEDFWIRSDEVSRLAVLTLIYRAIPPPENSPSTFIPECIETARTALEIHQTCMNMLRESNEATKCSYLHWALLYAPFVPFIVLFCHVIEVSSRADLVRLEDFVSSLGPNCFLSEAIAKLHSLCQVLSNVARLYVEAKAQAQIPENQGLASVGQEFDTYLSALGLAPASGEGVSRWSAAVTEPLAARTMPEIEAGMEGQFPANMMSQTQLGSWFSGNQHMMGLLEEDMSLWDPATWPYS
ncbi:putative C6 transcription factor [Aspergillus clavatus NRRL 1]|uniref:Fungal specific transcription factor domain protein n=1 Tax=Aspergillus clavatus (strain ATCC 1007 / CBS 513.65 / DSM 816 / NCTC 3887 / NRRL 1 / QM 1276 / 107) TaxID=344612 RepID=A1C549_ASPCL|nr:fungal specific transcription factor domain protein [Aspergillus clavatus NRRL 1]EAW14817.1 fungal specific transcription factor domain protein [Aspergillus clavatus NRRL 1]